MIDELLTKEGVVDFLESYQESVSSACQAFMKSRQDAPAMTQFSKAMKPAIMRGIAFAFTLAVKDSGISEAPIHVDDLYNGGIPGGYVPEAINKTWGVVSGIAATLRAAKMRRAPNVPDRVYELMLGKWYDTYISMKQVLEAAPAIQKSLEDYNSSLRAEARLLYSSEDRGGFFYNMQNSIERNIAQAWFKGMEECGIGPDEISPEEESARLNLIVTSMGYIQNLADYILKLKQDNKPVDTAFARLAVWGNRYNEAYNMARSMACGNKKMRWDLGPTEHCDSCLSLAGKVKRASYWKEHILPQSRELDCGGWRCQCTLSETEEPQSRGPLPKGF